MKKLKLIPGLILLALCVAVLGVGIYAASPASNTITGTVSVTAASPEVEIQVYNGSLSNSIVGPITTRTAKNFALGTLEFKTTAGQALANANTVDDVADIDLIFKITNNSSKKLGAYFSGSSMSQRLNDIVSASDREDAILASKDYNTGLVTATFNQYYPINISGTIYYVVSFHLNSLSESLVNITLDNTIFLNIEEYTSGLAKSMENYSISADGSIGESGGPSGALTIPSKACVGGSVITFTEVSSFMDCDEITSIEIPKTIKSIGEMAFQSCTSLETITGMEGVEECYGNPCKYTEWYSNQTNNAVLYLNNVCLGWKGTMPSSTTITFTSGTRCIAREAFANNDIRAERLIEINVPETVKNIGFNAFNKCTNLATITGMMGVEYCDENFSVTSWYTAQTNNAELPSIGSVYLGWKGTMPASTSITIPNGIKCIAYNAFRSKTNLSSVAFPNTLKSICSYAFYGCTGLTGGLSIPSVTTLGSTCFYGCTGLNGNLNVSSVEIIGGSAFKNCSGLTGSLDMPALTKIDYDAFGGCSGLNGTVNIPIIKAIAGSAFAGCSNITSVTMSNVVTIGGSAFSGCANLTAIDLSSVANLEYQAFYNCTNLASITGFNNLEKCGRNVFSGTAWYVAQSDGVVYLGNNCVGYKGTMPSDTSITITSGTKLIAGGAFEDRSNLVSIAIPDSILYIGGDAFSGTGITEISYGGTMAQWNSIVRKDYSWDSGADSLVQIACSDGNIEHALDDD